MEEDLLINIPLNKESIELRIGTKYIITDALSINNIKEELLNLKHQNIVSEIRSKVFPFTDTPFSEYVPTESIFKVEGIKKIDSDQIKTLWNILQSIFFEMHLIPRQQK